jgi:hypothetical protein
LYLLIDRFQNLLFGVAVEAEIGGEILDLIAIIQNPAHIQNHIVVIYVLQIMMAKHQTDLARVRNLHVYGRLHEIGYLEIFLFLSLILEFLVFFVERLEDLKLKQVDVINRLEPVEGLSR